MVSNKKIFMVVNVDWFFLSHRLQLAKSMLADGNDVYIIAKDTGRKQEIINHGLKFIDAPFERSGTNPLEELGLITFLYKLYKGNRPDIVHHITIKPAIYGSVALRFFRSNIKLVNAISGLGYNFIGNRTSMVQKLVLRLMNIGFKRKGVNFIFQNPDDRAFYNSLNYLSDTNNIIIKGAGVDHTEYDYVEPIRKNKLQVVFSGRMLLDKGVVEFMEATKLIRNKYINRVEFILMGDIDLNNKASANSELLQHYLEEGYLTWIGYQQDVKSVLINSDIVCLPSYREGLPKALIEAMAIGRPIVTTDTPGCRECVDDNINGFLVPVKSIRELAEKFEVLIDDESLRWRMGKASRDKMIKELSLENVICETKRFYFKLINE
jgi:glycosyltransferase involved in cell wall biosynthesis